MNFKELKKLNKKIIKFYKQTDKETYKFSKKSGVSCIENCGKCCQYDDISVSYFELLPMVFKLHKEKKLDFYYSKLHDHAADNMCMFYSENENKESKGHCRYYNERFLVCRLFGFSAFIKKDKTKDYTACAYIKQKYKDRITSVNKEINSGLFLPVLSEKFIQFAALDPRISLQLYSINEAFKLMAEKFMLKLKFKKHN